MKSIKIILFSLLLITSGFQTLRSEGLSYKYPLYPYANDLSQTLTFKVMLKCALPTDVSNMDMALVSNYLRQIDCITRGMPKIVVLGGYQQDGHDHQYPSWTPVESGFSAPGRLKGKDALQWLMNEAKKYNTHCTFHVNPFDAYEDSHLWNEYLENDLFCKTISGSLVKGGVWWNRQSYFVNMVNEWNKGYTQKRIDAFLKELPLVKETGVLYFDNITQYPASPRHGVTSRDQITAIKRAAQYLKEEHGIQLIGEYADPNLYGFNTLGVTWDWNESLNINQMEIPAYIACGGRNMTHDALLGQKYDISKRRFEVFGTSMQLEDIQFQYDPSKVLREFTHHTLVYFYLNRLLREEYTTFGTYGISLKLSDNVESVWDDGVHRIYRDGKLMKEGYDVFMPVYWVNHKEIMAYSYNGRNSVWDFPREWKGIETVDIYKFNDQFYGLSLAESNVAVDNSQIYLKINPGEAQIIVPHGVDPNTRNTIYDMEPSGEVEFIAEDAITKGNWKNKYGSMGYDIFGADNKIPDDVKIKYFGDKLEVLSKNSSNANALSTYNGDQRIEAVRTSALHQIIDVDVENPEGKTLSLYFADYKNKDIQILVDVIDVNTKKVLHSFLLNEFMNSGKYLSYRVKGNVQFRLTRFFYDGYRNPDYPVCSGLFIDGDLGSSSINEISPETFICYTDNGGDIYLDLSNIKFDEAVFELISLCGNKILRKEINQDRYLKILSSEFNVNDTFLIATLKTENSVFNKKMIYRKR